MSNPVIQYPRREPVAGGGRDNGVDCWNLDTGEIEFVSRIIIDGDDSIEFDWQKERDEPVLVRAEPVDILQGSVSIPAPTHDFSDRNRLLEDAASEFGKAGRARGAQLGKNGGWEWHRNHHSRADDVENYHAKAGETAVHAACKLCPLRADCPMSPEQLIKALKRPVKESKFRDNLKKHAKNNTLDFCSDIQQ